MDPTKDQQFVALAEAVTKTRKAAEDAEAELWGFIFLPENDALSFLDDPRCPQPL